MCQNSPGQVSIFIILLSYKLRCLLSFVGECGSRYLLSVGTCGILEQSSVHTGVSYMSLTKRNETGLQTKRSTPTKKQKRGIEH